MTSQRQVSRKHTVQFESQSQNSMNLMSWEDDVGRYAAKQTAKCHYRQIDILVGKSQVRASSTEDRIDLLAIRVGISRSSSLRDIMTGSTSR